MTLDSFEGKAFQIAEMDNSEMLEKMNGSFESSLKPIDGFFRDADITPRIWQAFQAGEWDEFMLVDEPMVAIEDGTETIGKIATEKEEALEKNTVRHFDCRNKELAESVHPETGVRFETRTIIQESGRVDEGVFPQFDSVFKAKIYPRDFAANNSVQFKKCNQQLFDKIKSDPSFRKQFSDIQIEQIRDGIIDGTAPDGYVWHHNEVEGVLELVDSAIHAKTGHTGGRSIWGGGY